MKTLERKPFIGDTYEDVLEYRTRLKKTVTKHGITMGDIHYRFNKTGRVILVERTCRKCRATFKVDKIRYIMDSCPDCRKKNRISDIETKSPYRQTFRQQAVTERTCMMCGDYFLSQGPHNRRCPGCDEKAGKLRDSTLVYGGGLSWDVMSNLN